MLWTSMSAPNIILRIGFVAAVFIPLVRYNLSWLPAVVTLFWCISTNGYSYSYMPTELYIYVLLLLALCIADIRIKCKIHFAGEQILWFFLLYTILIDIVNGLSMTQFNFSLAIILLMTFFISDEDKKIVERFEIVFMVLSLVMSFYSLTTRAQFAISMDDMERVGWTDPNYLSSMIAMGVLIAFGKILKFSSQTIYIKLLSLICFSSSLIVMLSLASRGAFLALFGGMIVMMLTANTSKTLKTIVPLFLFAFLYYLYTNDYFYILESRIEADDGTGSNRTIIWKSKIDDFMEQNPLRWIFGNGQRGAFNMGGTRGVGGFHNDYLAVLCGYGVIGFLFFIFMLCLPLKLSASKSGILPYMLLLIVPCFTLEPITAGWYAYFAFYLYIILRAKFYKEQT